MLITLLIGVIIAGLIWYLLSMLPIPAPFKNVVLIIFIVICIIWLLGFVGYPYWHGGHSTRLP